MITQATILHAEDDESDAFLFRVALSKAGVSNPLVQVPDGEAALQYLRGVGGYADREKYPFPGLLVTDLKMPRLSGFDLLAALKDDFQFKPPRTIVLTASVAESDKERCGQLGADAFFVKPTEFGGLIELAYELKSSWIPSISQPA